MSKSRSCLSFDFSSCDFVLKFQAAKFTKNIKEAMLVSLTLVKVNVLDALKALQLENIFLNNVLILFKIGHLL